MDSCHIACFPLMYEVSDTLRRSSILRCTEVLEALGGPCGHAAWSCLQATYAKLTWNAPGTGLLALTATDTDATNQSYYGEQKLSFLSADGANDCLVQLKVSVVPDLIDLS